jgi:hypothetical protein
MAGFWYSGTNELKGSGANDALKAMGRGHTVMSFGGQGVSVQGGGATNIRMLGQIRKGGLGSVAMSSISPVFSTYFAYQGYKGNLSDRSGIMGLADALSIDYSTMLATRQFAGPRTITSPAAAGGVTTVKPPGVFRTIRVGLGASVGASIGNAILGTPGSVIGGLSGGAAMANPILGAGVLAGATVGYGAYSILKSGYRHGRNIRLGNAPHTAGDTSSFFTQNAFTMRSQAVQAMRNSHMNARSALGQEATFMHTNKNYFSTYR